VEKLKQVFDTGWQDQGQIDWEGEEPDQKTSAWSVLEKYFTDTPIKPNEMPEAVEVPAEADLSIHGLPTLIGVLDLVRAGGKIVDFKSTGKTPDNDMALHQNGLQLDCYSVLYRESTGKREAGRELHHLVKTKQPKIVITEAGPMMEYQRNRLFRVMESYVNGLEREDFVPAVGMQCAGCEFRHECQKWS
jgi:putative RecB family exonuclease